MSSPTTYAEAAEAQYDLMRALSALHVGGKYADLTITCNYKQWACHKAIVCSRSGFFDGACSSTFREGNSGIIDISEDDEDAVEQMIHFFYYNDYLEDKPHQQPSAMFRHRAYSNPRKTPAKMIDLAQIEDPLLAAAGFYTRPATPPSSRPSSKGSFGAYDYCPPSPTGAFTPPPELESWTETFEVEEQEEESTEDESHLILHTQVYALAEKYDIPALKQLAQRKFEMAMACYYDAPEFADAIEEVYCSTIDTDRGLRDVVLQAFRSHPQLAHTQDVYAVIQQTPSLALDLFKVERGIPV